MGLLAASRSTPTPRLSGTYGHTNARFTDSPDGHATLRYAIKGAPNQKLLLEDIYYAIESRVRAQTAICLFVAYVASVPILPNSSSWLEGTPS